MTCRRFSEPPAWLMGEEWAEGSRRHKAQAAWKMRLDGTRLVDIGQRLGLAKSMVAELIVDPTGEESRARKLRYATPCIDCGGETRPDGGSMRTKRCQECSYQHQRDEARWTQDAIIAAMQDWARRHDGRAPSASQWRGAGTDHPASSHVQWRFEGGWNDAVVSAGLPINRKGSPGPGTLTQAKLDETVRVYRETGSLILTADRLNMTHNAISARLDKAGYNRPKGTNVSARITPSAVLGREIDREEQRLIQLRESVEEAEASLAQLREAKKVLERPTNGASG